ncbi:MAG: hypothetical protein ACJ8CR_03635 [Roseiflexaceae bacterium]
MDITESLLAELDRYGLLLQQDLLLPNVVAAVAGEPLHGSWWSHPSGHTIFNCLNALAQHPSALVTRLVGGKITFVHRRLWPAVLGVACARAPWQFARLPAPARDLYASVERQGMLLATGKQAKDLERRLLVHGEQVHTEKGHHELRLESWPLWAERAGCRNSLTEDAGQRQLEAAVQSLGGAAALLPWKKALRGSAVQ